MLANAAEDQDVLEELEYADWRIATAPAETFHNPPGFYISVLKDNVAVPDTFESSRKLRDREELARKRDAELLRQAQIEIAYEDYKRKTVERYIEQSVSVDEHEALFAELQRSYVLQFKNASQWPSETFALGCDERGGGGNRKTRATDFAGRVRFNLSGGTASGDRWRTTPSNELQFLIRLFVMRPAVLQFHLARLQARVDLFSSSNSRLAPTG